ncbi:hypothetical protein COY28_03965 [Candidatus Woesearchaeota archaeon CG_4_10_14_0_2_um_filter_57_5]|nr:MAG: hypothetical protein COY28_03965 [Candidatus Woesearchaeota archaeon CG_4_10_14_0_2_um_filter_57_5]
MNKTEYKQIVAGWADFTVPSTLPRQIEVRLDNDFIQAITGPRRAGKTFLCFQVMEHLRTQGVPENNILYLNFEDNRLIGAGASDLDGLYSAFLELRAPVDTSLTYLFLDEIQAVRDWDSWIRKMHDREKGVRLLVTGSSSKMLSREIATKLRGRVLSTEVLPLSFSEYCVWNGFSQEKGSPLYGRTLLAIQQQHAKYLVQGGFPALASQNVPAEQVLRSYFESMMFQDIAERNEIRDLKRLRVLAGLLFSSVGKEVSYTRIANRMRSMGFTLSKNTVIEHMSQFEDAYLFFQVLKHEYSLARQVGAIKKLYCVDNGLLDAVSPRFSGDAGRLLENEVFLELRRRGADMAYGRNGNECDFLLREKGRVTGALQVTQELTEQNEAREFAGLQEAMDKHNLATGTIITLEQEQRKDRITIVPVCKWLLEAS